MKAYLGSKKNIISLVVGCGNYIPNWSTLFCGGQLIDTIDLWKNDGMKNFFAGAFAPPTPPINVFYTFIINLYR